MNNRYLLMFYVNMIAEDYEQDFNKFKYLGLLENPEGFKELESQLNVQNKLKWYKDRIPYESGEEADKNMTKPSEFNQKREDSGIELG